jgi:secreted PhoX family phosphatase
MIGVGVSGSSPDGLSRRAVLARTATGAGIMLSGSYSGLFGAGATPARAAGRGTPGGVGYGPLVPDPNGLLSLPEGFSYTVVAQSGVTRLESGEPTPSDPDGTAAFVRHGGNGSVLVDNHEVAGPADRPHRLTRCGSVLSATPAWLETVLSVRVT